MQIISDILAMLALGLSTYNFVKARKVVSAPDVISVFPTTEFPIPVAQVESFSGHQRQVKRSYFVKGRR